MPITRKFTPLRRCLTEPNFPVLAGYGLLALGALMFAMALKKPWYQVPAGITPDDVLLYATPKCEKPLKLVFALCLLVGCGIGIWNWFRPLARARSFLTTGSAAFVIGLVFAHRTVIDEAELSHLASWTLLQHDNLTWLGGDIYTAREFEQVGGGLDLFIKDPPQILGSVPPPHQSLDLAILHDAFEWLGLGATFTTFKKSGWGFLMVGSILFFVGALATRTTEAPDKLCPDVITFGMRALAIPLIGLLTLVGARVWISAGALQEARLQGDSGDYAAASQSIKRAIAWLPCTKFDTGILLQQGLYDHQRRFPSAQSKFYRALELESGNFKARAESIYATLTTDDNEAVRREAYRALFRIGIIDFNSGQETEALRHVESLIQAFPSLPKPHYARLLLAVRLREIERAFQSHRNLYTIADGIGLGEKRAYLSSGHQHLGELAFTDGEFQEAWQQYVNRIELEK